MAVVEALNHCISGKGIPISFLRRSQCSKILSQLVPITDYIVFLYEQMGDQLSFPQNFGDDSL